MGRRRPRPSLLARLLLRLRPLGDRRGDIEADLEELFATRVASHGFRYARRRYLIDVLSLWRRAPGRRGQSAASLAFGKPRWFSGAGGDLAYAVRVFRRQAAVVSIAMAGLGVSIAMTTVVFAITNALNFRPLGVPDPDAVVTISRTVTSFRGEPGGPGGWPYADFTRLRQASRLVRIEASVRATPDVSAVPGGENAQEVDLRFVTGTFVKTFGGRTILGRAFDAGDDTPGAAAVAVLHHAYWRASLGSDPTVVGRTLYFNNVPVTVVGVLDRRSTGPFQMNFAPPSILVPLSAARAIEPNLFDAAGGSTVSVIGMLARLATISQAEAEVSAIATSLGLVREATTGRPAIGVAVRPGGNQFTADDLALLSIFMTIVGLVLLLAVTNVANLLLAGATTRQQEIGARLALGASRGRIVRQLTTESLLLGGLSGVAGLVLATWLTPLVTRLIKVPPAVDLTLDVRVYLFAAVVSMLVGIAAGLAPARYGAGGDLVATLKGGNSQAGSPPRAARLRSTFLGLQAAASVMLLVLTALFARVLLHASRAPLGADPNRMVVVSAFAPRAGSIVPSDQFWGIALARVRALPPVESAALVDHPPFSSGFHPVAATLDGRRYPLRQNKSSAEYFETAGFRVLQGRTYTAAEVAENAPVAVITSTLARDFWPAGDALGSNLERIERTWTTVRVIGVVSDGASKIWPPNWAGASVIYRPLDQPEVANMMVRVADGATAPLQAIRDAAVAIDASRRPRVSLLSAGVQEELEGPRLFAASTAIVGGLALTLAVIGVFGVTAFVVNQRRREIGIRMAIGAERGDVIRNVFGQGMRPIAIGLAVGLGVAFFGTQVIGRALAGVSPRDPIAFVAAAAVLLVAAGFGVLIPARRAALVDPAVVLKEQ